MMVLKNCKYLIEKKNIFFLCGPVLSPVVNAVPFPVWMPFLILTVIQLWDLNRLHLHLEVGAKPLSQNDVCLNHH